MPEVGEIEKQIKALKEKVGKKKAEAQSAGTGVLRELKKKLRRAQRRRRAVVALEKRLQERNKPKTEEAKPGEAAGA